MLLSLEPVMHLGFDPMHMHGTNLYGMMMYGG